MTYVIAEPCIGTRDASCVSVCPVDCIHPMPDTAAFNDTNQLYIDPVECIDCAACEGVCPVNAIFREEELPVEWAHYKDLNANHFTQAT